MAEESFQDKTEPATAKRREEARKKGDVAKSKELSSMAVLLAGACYLILAGKDLAFRMGDQIKATFVLIPGIMQDDFKLVDFLNQTIKTGLVLILPLLLTVFVVAILINYMQTGFLWSPEALTPQLSKLNPLKGASRLISRRALVELAKSVAKLVIVGWAAFSVLREEIGNMVPLLYQDRIQISTLLGTVSLKVLIRCFWVIIILAILDYVYQKWEYEERLKMTKQEVKEEYKHTEGDPLVKARIRSVQREMARKRMMQEVPKADVVITNPLHLAVALRYEPQKMAAPKVVAKGAEKIAKRIRELAQANRIPILENKTLAQNLYKLDLGEEVPSQFYQAVAEILAYVYNLKKKTVKA